MIIYVVTYIYGDSSIQIWFAAPIGVAAVLVMLFMPRLNRRFEAKTLFKISIWWYSIGLIIVYFIGVQNWILTAVLLFFVTGSTGIFNIIPTIMAADTIDYWEHKTGFRQEGITFSIMSLKNKVGLGLKDFIIGYFLAYFMFNTSDSSILSHQPRQFEYTQQGMFFMFLVMPAILTLFSLIPLKFYDLNKKKLAEMAEELKLRREKEHDIKNDNLALDPVKEREKALEELKIDREKIIKEGLESIKKDEEVKQGK